MRNDARTRVSRRATTPPLRRATGPSINVTAVMSCLVKHLLAINPILKLHCSVGFNGNKGKSPDVESLYETGQKKLGRTVGTW